MYFSPDQTNFKFGLWQMGKRIKWFSDAECDMIRAGNFSYIMSFQLENEESQEIQSTTTADLQQKYRTLEFNRLTELKSRS